MTLEQHLSEGMKSLGYHNAIDTSHLENKLIQYVALIQKWNGVHNLTAIRDPKAMLTNHIIDSLAILPHITGPRVADIGSGAGLPGIPIAIMQSEWQIVLIESNQKKSAFLRQAKIELHLDNIEIISDRVEHYQPQNKFNTIVSRALSSLESFTKMSKHLADKNNSQFAAMKGSNLSLETDDLPQGFIIDRIIPLTVPGLNAARHLVIIRHA